MVIIAVVVVIVLLYLAFHLGAGHTHYRYQKAHYTRHKSDGLRPNFYWSPPLTFSAFRLAVMLTRLSRSSTMKPLPGRVTVQPT